MYTLMQATGSSKLNYWGFSYGTYLGVTFASLYPDAVNLMVNDGNVDAVEYTDSRGVGFIHDTESVMDAFFHFCYLAGDKTCLFWDRSEDAIRARLSMVLEGLKRSPVVVPARDEGGRPEIVSYSSVKRLVTSTLYRPLIMFPALATVLAALERRDGEPFLALRPPISQDPFVCTPSESDTEDVEGTADAEKAIMCSDNNGVDESVDVFREYVDELVRLSPTSGATMAEMRLGCVGWSVKAKWRFNGKSYLAYLKSGTD
jgi:pimeloyl-ACP methyl ester carboxylesterase